MRRFYLFLFAMAFTVVAYGQSLVTLHPHRGPLRDFLMNSSARTVAPDTEWEKLHTTSALDSFLIAFMSTNHVPGLAACIIKKDSIVWQGYYGYADISKNKPVTDSTIFMLASVSKTIMATALMQLYEAGRFQLDDSVNGYLPFSVRNPYHPSVPITFKMLLTHTSSIQDNYGAMPYVIGDDTMPLGTYLHEYFTPGGIYYSPSLNFYTYVPGTTWNYSNIGATLAGYLVEVISGVPFDRYCRDSVFSRLQMPNTAWFLRDLDTTRIARPYTYSSGTYIDNGLYGYPDYPDGQLRTTVASLARFLMANMNWGELEGSRILDSSIVRLMRTVYVPTCPGLYSDNQWGLIWFKEKWSGYGLWGHTGGDAGVATSIWLSESDTTGVLFLSNITWTPYTWRSVVKRLIDEAHLYGNIYAVQFGVDRQSARKGIDSLLFTARFSNIYNHPFTPHVIYSNLSGTRTDSLPLFDDGLHGDSLADDGLFGVYIPAPNNEDFFTISVSTLDLQSNKYFIRPDLCRFTTIGPMVIDSTWSRRNAGGVITLAVWLRNAGSDSTIYQVKGNLTTSDSNVESFPVNNQLFGTLAPHQRTGRNFAVKIDTSLTCTDLQLSLDVQAGYEQPLTYWTHGLVVPVRSAPTVNRSSVDFGVLDSGETRTDSLRIKNPNTCTVHIVSAASDAPAQFSVSPPIATIAPLDSCTLHITFHPTAYGSYSGHITLIHNAEGSPSMVNIAGICAPPRIQFSVEPRWNMISMPVKVKDGRKSTLFPASSSSAYSYRGGYHEADSLESGVGYWLKFPAVQTVEISGILIYSDTIMVVSGWNMVSSIAKPLPVAMVWSIPPGITTTGFYQYAGGPNYIPADTIKPGHSYWVKAGQAGELILSSAVDIPLKSRIRILQSSELPPPPPSEEMLGTDKVIPAEYALAQAYPNPFNPSTTIYYQLPQDSRVSLIVYNTLGQLVAVLVDGIQGAGYKKVEWNASSVPSGVYFYRLVAGDFNQVRKMLVIR